MKMSPGYSRLGLNLAVVALTVGGILSVVFPAAGSAMTATGSCASTREMTAVGLIIAPKSVSPAQRVQFRVDNTAGPTITYGAGYNVQECIAGVWKLAPFSPAAATRQRIRQRPSRGRWWDAPIPATAVAGHYRIRKLVEIGGSGRWLYGDFNIVAPTGFAKPWHFVRQLGRHTVELGFSVGVCDKNNPPAINPRVVEKRERAVITLWVSAPELPPGTLCQRILARKKVRVRLGSPVATLELFDGFSSPPKLRWSGPSH